MASASHEHDLKQELGINADQCPTFRKHFDFEQQKALINEDLITCDLIVGLLWRRWGSTTKKYSSGFLEE